jgi:4-hydroxy-tetrahydrodipicolinate reductase
MHLARIVGKQFDYADLLKTHHELVFGGLGQTLTIRHDSISRESFMPGVVAAIRYVVKHPGLTVGLEKVLGL